LNLVAGMVVADRFKLERKLGEGGMGAIWLAHHTGLDVPCAVKFIHADAATSAEVRARFEREAKGAAQLRSPNVVQILDHGTWEGTPYIAMEYLEGEDLEARLTRQRKLGVQETLGITMQVARALQRAHAAGLVHRDLKPANIFLVHDDDREIAKVLDFGIAKSQSPSLTSADSKTKTGSVMGTPYYMSPEQAQGTKEVDHRSDLWALAVVVYQCLTGELPFDSSALGDLFVKIIVNPIPVPSRVAAVPAGFDAWWARAAARDPNERFQSAKELADALAPALGLAGSGTDPSLLSRASGAELSRASSSDGGSWPEIAPRPRLQTAGPVVAALTAVPANRGGRSLAPLIAGAVFVVALSAGAAFFIIGKSAPPQRPSAADLPPTAAAPIPTLAPAEPVVVAPIVSAAPIASAAAPIASAAPIFKTPIAKTPPPKTGEPTTKAPPVATTKKKTDFGI
jgi:eukaryotic-like serine/threonine-protein kinase